MKVTNFVASFKKGVKLKVSFIGAESADAAGDENQWTYREPVIMPLDAKGNIGLTPINLSTGQAIDGSTIVTTWQTGKYLFTFAPESAQGWMGQAKICTIG